MEGLIIVSGRAGTGKQGMSDFNSLHQQCGRQYKSLPTPGSPLFSGKRRIAVPFLLEVRHGCSYWTDIANKMRTTGICITFGPKHLILAGQLTRPPSFFVTTFNTWKQVFIWRCHKIKQPEMMSQQYWGHLLWWATWSCSRCCFSKNFSCGQMRSGDCLLSEHDLPYPDQYWQTPYWTGILSIGAQTGIQRSTCSHAQLHFPPPIQQSPGLFVPWALSYHI